MQNNKLIIIAILIGVYSNGMSQELSKAKKIEQAVMAAPEDQRKEATVLGFNEKGDLETLKKGSNELICIADNPKKDGFNVVCYHKSLEPFMARGRALRNEGKNMGEVKKIRGEEVKSGKLSLPEGGKSLHILYGDTPETSNYRYVVYLPFATQESTGLPLAPLVPGGPWLMEPGTHRAHIMISTPNK